MAAQQLLVTDDAGLTREVAVAFGVRIGGTAPVVLAHASIWDSEEDLLHTAHSMRSAGVDCLVAAMPVSPYRDSAKAMLAQMAVVRRGAGICVAVPVTDAQMAVMADAQVDLLVVNGCQMQDFSLLKVLGRLKTAIMLERGPAVTDDEWLMSAEYILAGGNRRVILCSGPSRRSDGMAGWTVDLPGALAVRGRTHLPVIVDLTRLDPLLAAPLARASAAAGLHGVVAPAAAMAKAAEAMGLTPAPVHVLTARDELTVY